MADSRTRMRQRLMQNFHVYELLPALDSYSKHCSGDNHFTHILGSGSAIADEGSNFQAESRIRVPSTVTVVMERPRTGGVAINCSQIFSSQFSKSASEMLDARARRFWAAARKSFLIVVGFCSAFVAAAAVCFAIGTEGLECAEKGDGLSGFKRIWSSLWCAFGSSA